MDVEKTIPCKICKEPTTFLGTKLCHGCWEVTRRISDFLRRGTHKAVEILIKEIEDYLTILEEQYSKEHQKKPD